MVEFAPARIKGVILDMDGVLWRGSEIIVDLQKTFQRFSELNLRVLVATNNSTRTPEIYFDKLSQFGVQLEDWQFINSSQVTAAYLAEQHPQGGAVFVIGESGLRNALEEANFSVSNDGQNVIAVVAGMDHSLTYQKIDLAARLIRKGVPFLGTNPDKTFPTPSGLSPGAGVVLAALEAASGVSPYVLGKPEPAMFKTAVLRLGTRTRETLMVGDRIETDITGALNAGLRTALVLSGVTSRSIAEKLQPGPDIIAENLDHVLNWLERK
jgi:4-nitrophenyl phosphatase